MLIADRRGFFRRSYEVRDDTGAAAPVELVLSTWGRTGEFVLDGVVHEIRMRRRFLMGYDGVLVAGGRELAHAQGVGTTEWELQVDDRHHRFVRPHLFGRTQHVVESGEVVGVVRRVALVSGAEADLPDLALPVQLFVVGALLLVWEEESS
ncbi:hypothetical protein [Pseudonocardia broussonetiae]|uniref:Uncharacterized protein n=1 Tax=Pseudonocardia broussonetiae TaxID=2736640 RepID=A0A6M6JN44_9PSEU|nr:hypothetical protein [Pseudonocardia broussonetiae]QJY49378.1 hypothetical protein HOP40_29480 [Pseudonocardia broussonetiae]